MAKVKLPLLSQEARGELGRAMIFQQQSVGGAIVKRFTLPKVGHAVSQLRQRQNYRTALDGWLALDEEAQQGYRTRARPLHLLAINLYIQENIGPSVWIIGTGVIGEVMIA